MLEKGHSLQGKRERREDGGPGTVGRRPWAVPWGGGSRTPGSGAWCIEAKGP